MLVVSVVPNTLAVVRADGMTSSLQPSLQASDLIVDPDLLLFNMQCSQ